MSSMSISGHQRRSRLCGREDKFSGGKTIGHEMPLGISNPCGIIGILRAEPLGEGVRGRREKMADQVRHDEAAEARGRLPPLEAPSGIAYFFRFSAVWGDFPLSETRKSAIFDA